MRALQVHLINENILKNNSQYEESKVFSTYIYLFVPSFSK